MGGICWGYSQDENMWAPRKSLGALKSPARKYIFPPFDPPSPQAEIWVISLKILIELKF